MINAVPDLHIVNTDFQRVKGKKMKMFKTNKSRNFYYFLFRMEREPGQSSSSPDVGHDGSQGEGGKGRGRPARGVDFPLRILVSSDMVGAIIGRGGATIRTITQETRARVDVHRSVKYFIIYKSGFY